MNKRDCLTAKGFCIMVFLFIISFLFRCPLDLFGRSASPEKAFKIEIKDSLISLDIRGAELSEVLREIGTGMGVKMVIAEELRGKKITTSFKNLYIENALENVLRDYYYILTFTKDPAHKDKYVLKEVKVQGNVIGTKTLKGRTISVDIPYGSGKREVGAVTDGEGALIGPRSFTVDDKGNIYICDTVNGRVQIFSPDGNYISTVSLKGHIVHKSKNRRVYGSMIEDIAVDNSGFIYIYDDMGKLYQYDRKGKVLNIIKVNGNRWEIEYEMFISSNDIYVHACDRGDACGYFLVGKISNSRLVSPSVEESKKPKENFFESGKHYSVNLSDFGRWELKIKEKDGKTSRIISFPLKGIISSEFLGEDRRGNIFIKTDRDADDEKLSVGFHKFNPVGDYIGTIRMAKSNINFWSVRNYILSNDGTIYRFLPEEDKLRLNIFFSESDQ